MNGRISTCAWVPVRRGYDSGSPASLSSSLFQVQWVQGHNPDLIVLDDNGHEKDLSCKNGRATLIGIECVMKLRLSFIALSHLPVLNRD